MDASSLVVPCFGKYTNPCMLAWFFSIFSFTFIFFFAVHPNKEFYEDGVRQIPTISLTGAIFPSNIIFTYGLHFGSIAVAVLFGSIHVCYENRFLNLKTETVTTDINCLIPFCGCKNNSTTVTSMRWWNLRLLYLGEFAALMMSLVGSVSLLIDSFLHGTFAFLMFAASVIHMIAFYNHIQRFAGVSIGRIRMHRLACFICIPLSIILFVTALVVYLLCSATACTEFFVDIGAVIEFSTCVGLMVYAYQFQEDMETTQLCINPTSGTPSSPGHQGNATTDNVMLSQIG